MNNTKSDIERVRSEIKKEYNDRYSVYVADNETDILNNKGYNIYILLFDELRVTPKLSCVENLYIVSSEDDAHKILSFLVGSEMIGEK